MTTIKLPPTLSVEAEEVQDPADLYGEPLKIIISVMFGNFTIINYELNKLEGFSGFYFDGEDNRRILYDTPEEFIAEKLKKLFRSMEEKPDGQ